MTMSSSLAPWQRRHLQSQAMPCRVSLRMPSPLHTLHFLFLTSFLTAPEFLAYSASTKLRRSEVEAVVHHSSLVSIFLPSGWGWLLPGWPPLLLLPPPRFPPKPNPPLLPPPLVPPGGLAFGWVFASVSRPP